MKQFLTNDFILETETARRLYHDHAARMPIFDFHCHLSPEQIAEDKQFENLTDIWLRGDHYKWRAMRTNGIEERRITGDADDREKFQAFAETVPATIGNPIYHWTHMELRRPFGIDDLLLGPDTAEEVWRSAGDMLGKPEFTARGIMKQMNVKVVCTTDDPVDDLAHHERIAADPTAEVTVRPAFRPDKAFHAESPSVYNEYLDRLEQAAGVSIRSLDDLKSALRGRLDYFEERGCRLSDHALEAGVFHPQAEAEAPAVFKRLRAGEAVSGDELDAFVTAVLLFLGREYARRGWVLQLHIGAQRNNNTRFFERLGPDTGFDSMADAPYAKPLARFLDALDVTDELPKTIIYILNPRDNDMIASLIGCYQDGSVPGKVQFGSAWWFNDQKDGMERHLTAVANMSLLRQFVGMLTDSRSFLSFPRHEYFRRILCNLVGGWVERGEAPADMDLLGGMVEDIAWNNAREFF
ncbi:MAG: glucuronate isomerase, partial [Spirochaetaceae bacterium]